MSLKQASEQHSSTVSAQFLTPGSCLELLPRAPAPTSSLCPVIGMNKPNEPSPPHVVFGRGVYHGNRRQTKWLLGRGECMVPRLLKGELHSGVITGTFKVQQLPKLQSSRDTICNKMNLFKTFFWR